MMVQLNQLLDGLDIEIQPFAVCEIRPGAGLAVSNPDSAHIHYVMDGAGVVRSEPGDERRLVRHTVIVVPARLTGTFVAPGADGVEFPAPRCQAIPGGWDWLEVGAGDEGLVLACANLSVMHQGTQSLFAHLPAVLVESVAEEPAFKDAFRLLLEELAFPKPGTRVLAATLMKQCLVVLLRRYAEDGVCRAPWLAALAHPQLGAALEAMVARPDQSFTLEQLAELAGMSRASFASHFRRAFDRRPWMCSGRSAFDRPSTCSR